MRSSRFTEEQIIAALKEHAAGLEPEISGSGGRRQAPVS